MFRYKTIYYKMVIKKTLLNKRTNKRTNKLYIGGNTVSDAINSQAKILDILLTNIINYEKVCFELLQFCISNKLDKSDVYILINSNLLKKLEKYNNDIAILKEELSKFPSQILELRLYDMQHVSSPLQSNVIIEQLSNFQNINNKISKKISEISDYLSDIQQLIQKNINKDKDKDNKKKLTKQFNILLINNRIEPEVKSSCLGNSCGISSSIRSILPSVRSRRSNRIVNTSNFSSLSPVVLETETEPEPVFLPNVPLPSVKSKGGKKPLLKRKSVTKKPLLKRKSVTKK